MAFKQGEHIICCKDGGPAHMDGTIFIVTEVYSAYFVRKVIKPGTQTQTYSLGCTFTTGINENKFFRLAWGIQEALDVITNGIKV